MKPIIVNYHLQMKLLDYLLMDLYDLLFDLVILIIQIMYKLSFLSFPSFFNSSNKDLVKLCLQMNHK